MREKLKSACLPAGIQLNQKVCEQSNRSLFGKTLEQTS